MPQAEAREPLAPGAGTERAGVAVRKVKTRRLRAIAAMLEKGAILVAMALLTYALIAVDTRAATPSARPGDNGCVAQGIPYGILPPPWIGSA
jgi:hypothetical protein